MDDGFEMQFLGRDGRKLIADIKTHLVTEDAQRAGAGAISFAHTVRFYVLHQFQVLFHVLLVSRIKKV